MGSTETNTLGERLRSAIQGAGISVREFHRRMEARGVAGSSYPNVHRYLADSSEPTLEFLRHAAEVLAVRHEWLAVGDEPRTARELRTGLRLIRADLRPIGVADIGHPVAEPMMIELVSKLAAAQPPNAPEPSEADLSAAMRAIDKYLLIALGALTPTSTGTVDGTGGRFVVLSLMAMLAAVPGPQEGRPLAEVLAKLSNDGED